MHSAQPTPKSQPKSARSLASIPVISGLLWTVLLLESGLIWRMFPSQTSISWPGLVMVAICALVAQALPIERIGQKLTITLSLPFAAVAAVCFNPLAGLGIHMFSHIATYRIRSARRKRTTDEGFDDTPIAGVAFVGAVIILLIGRRANFFLSSAEAEILTFMAVYAVVNVTLIHFVEHVSLKNISRNGLGSILQDGSQLVGLYAIVGLLVAEFADKGLVFLIPLGLAPVLVLRRALLLQNDLYSHYYETIVALSQMLQRAHPYTHGHLERVSIAAEETARRLGMDSKRARLVREAAVLHDIGKIAVSEDVLDKPARLSIEEFNHVKRHSEWGAAILRPVRQFESLVPWILHHHERPDGRGYPNRLTDREIPVESKIIAVVDAFDAMTGGPGPGQQRTYREPMTIAAALVELERCSGTQFDTAVVTAFKAVVSEGYGT